MEPAGTLVPESGAGGDAVHSGLASLNAFFQQDAIAKRFAHPDSVSILGCIRTLIEVFICYGFSWDKLAEAKYLVAINKTFCFCESSGLHWMKYFKTRIADFFAVWNDQELSTYVYQKGENPKYILGGKFYNFTKIIMRGKLGLSFANSILMSKKGMPRADESLVKEAELKSFETMTSVKEPVKPWAFRWKVVVEDYYEAEHETLYGRGTMEYEIRRTTRELFRRWNFTLADLTRPVLPSTSSNYNRSRTKMGAYGEIDRMQCFKVFRKEVLKAGIPAGLVNLLVDDYVSEYYGEEGLVDREEHEKYLESREDSDFVLGLGLNISGFEKAYKKMFWKLFEYALNQEEALVEVVGLVEALKIRCISKGPPVTYFVLKPLQQSLHSHLRKNPIFQLIGEPITTELMNERFAKFIGEDYKFHSGDYEGATDNLYSWCSELVAEELADIFRERNGFEMGGLKTLLVRSLTGHTYVRYEDEENPVPIIAPQRRGQLMGSITSFPVLCILNATLMRKSLEVAESRGIPMDEFPGWINGDDCLTPYKKGSRFPEIWENLALQMGFKKSLGKTYDSDTFCSMNSHMFVVRGDNWELVPYVNLGLVHAVKRAVGPDGKEGDITPVEVGVLHRKLMETCPPSLKRVLTAVMIFNHKKVLDSFKGPWWLPCYMGGLGLESQEGYTDKDRHWAYHALQEASTNPVRFSKEKEWMLYDAFECFLRERGHNLIATHSFGSYDGDETYGRAFIAVAYHEWCRFGVKYLYNPHLKAEDKTLRALNSFNRSVQKRMLKDHKDGGYHRVKSDACFEVEKKGGIVPVRVYDVGGGFYRV
jgi:hypothetical protein